MANIGRNDTCYCGSGKKYKQCCLNIKSIGSYTFISGETVKTYREEDVVKQLMLSQGFKNFYEAERSNISNLYWVKPNEALESKLGFQKGQKGKMYQSLGRNGIDRLIVLEQICPSLNDAFLVAHEMCHILIINKGFPGISPCLSKDLGDDERNERIRLASSMTTMIHDPLCNSLLDSYGLSIGNLFQDYVADVLNDWKNVKEPSLNTYLGHIMVFKYVLTNLPYFMTTTDNNSLEIYNKFFENKFPHIIEEGKFVLDLINIWGYNTPEKLSSLYQDIINSMNLQDICKLQFLQ